MYIEDLLLWLQQLFWETFRLWGLQRGRWTADWLPWLQQFSWKSCRFFSLQRSSQAVALRVGTQVFSWEDFRLWTVAVCAAEIQGDFQYVGSVVLYEEALLGGLRLWCLRGADKLVVWSGRRGLKFRGLGLHYRLRSSGVRGMPNSSCSVRGSLTSCPANSNTLGRLWDSGEFRGADKLMVCPGRMCWQEGE